MKSQIISRIFHLIGKPGEQKLMTSRWSPIAALVCSFQGGDPETKAFKKGLSTYQVLENDLEALSDEMLIVLFERIVARYFTQM